jgi:hypothetical protein
VTWKTLQERSHAPRLLSSGTAKSIHTGFQRNLP